MNEEIEVEGAFGKHKVKNIGIIKHKWVCESCEKWFDRRKELKKHKEKRHKIDEVKSSERKIVKAKCRKHHTPERKEKRSSYKKL